MLRPRVSGVVRGVAARAVAASEAVGRRLARTPLRRSALGRHLVDLVLWPSDCSKVRWEFFKVFRRSPRLLAPRTFNEYLQASKLFRRRPSYVRFADKIAVREYVAARIGPQYLTRLYWTGTDLTAAAGLSLPPRFVVKANQGSGTNLIVTNAARFDWAEAARQAAGWLRHDHSVYFAEWQYRWVPPALLIEEFLEGPGGSVPLDYKFFCFRGRVQFVQVDFGRFGRHTRSLYDREFRLLPVGLHYPRHPDAADPPANFALMRRLAEQLSAGEPFLRVDLYDVGRPVFGELTLHPGAGLERFDPPEWDLAVGRLTHGRAELAPPA